MPTKIEPNENRTLIDALLDEQRQLTAAEKFSQRHEQHEVPLQEKFYRDLIPLSQPRFGEQFSFEVNLDACSGCKACVTACHSLNGLDDGESWRKVTTLTGRSAVQPFQQTVTSACHHCVEPACLNGCPSDAYEKDFATGIVRHLDDQCIGCQYCSWTCPYDVPQFSSKRGIVRKCDMCHSRLASGEAPACVQACPTSAITVRIVSKNEMTVAARENSVLSGSPDSTITTPTTIYISQKPQPKNLKAVGLVELEIQPSHLPLVFMLVLTQMAAGIFSADLLAHIFAADRMPENVSRLGGLFATAVCWLGLLASIVHLGRPRQGWRAVLGWRHSWLSREVIALGIFSVLAPASLAASGLVIALAVSLIGLFGVFTSAMVYHDTKREFWRLNFSAGKFLGTTFLLGFAALGCLGAFQSAAIAKNFAALLLLASLVKLPWEFSFFRNIEADKSTSLKRSAHLLRSKLRGATAFRFLAGVFGGIFLPFVFLANHASGAVLFFALLLSVVGELTERYLFFTAVAPPRMPGGIFLSPNCDETRN